MIARTIIITGQVQGVFFREWAIRQARDLGVGGWVRNRQDGSVEVYAVTGEPARMDDLVARMHKGSPASRVDTVRVEEAEVVPAEGFARRQTA